MARPAYAENITRYYEGAELRSQVEFTFGVMGETDADGRGVFYRDTLREDFAERTAEERQAEANARYDRWWEVTSQPAEPAVPTVQQLTENVAAAEQQMRDAQRNVLAARDALAAVPAITAVKDGSWSDPATWGGTVPEAGTPVVVPADVTVTIDQGVAVNASAVASDTP